MICSHFMGDSWWANGICPGQNIFDHDALSCLSFCLVACRLLLLPHGHIQGISLFASALFSDPQTGWDLSGVQESIGLMQFTPRLWKFVNWWVPWVVVSRSATSSAPPRMVSFSCGGIRALALDSFGVGLTTCCRALKLKCICIHQKGRNTTVLVWKAVSFHVFLGELGAKVFWIIFANLWISGKSQT